MEELARELERINPTRNVLASPLISAKWKLLYTTSASILGTSRPPFLRPQGPIFQTIGELQLLLWLSAHMRRLGRGPLHVLAGACRCGQSHGHQSGDLALLQPGMRSLTAVGAAAALRSVASTLNMHVCAGASRADA